MAIYGNFLNKNNESGSLKYSNSGLANYEQKKYGTAIQDFTKAIELHPKNQNLYLMRGTAYEDSGNDIAAEKDFRRTLVLEPNSFMAAYRIGMVYFRKNEIENAIMFLKLAHTKYPKGELSQLGLGINNILFVAKKIVSANLGNFLTKVNKFEEAFRFLDEAIQLDPRYHVPYLVKGLALAQIGKPSEGIPFVRKAMQLGNPNAENSLAMLEMLANQSSEDQEEDEELELDIVFRSSDHLRYENGRHISGPHGGAKRAVKIEPNTNGGKGYTVSMYNTDNGGAELQMAPKQMKLVDMGMGQIMLRGYGLDQMGSPFSDYGLTLFHSEEGRIEKMILHMYDRGVDIHYLR